MGKFDGQVVMVTGGARGQGRSHAIEFAREGADVIVTDIASQIDTVPYELSSQEDLLQTQSMVEDLDRRCLAITADARSTEATGAAVDAAIEQFGKIDILLINHGVVSMSAMVDISDDMWDDMLGVCLTGVFKTMRAVVPHMIEQNYGRIVATSSIAGKVGLGTISHYVAAKAGVLALVKSVAAEVADKGITVNAICPTAVDTDMIHNQANYTLFAPHIEVPTKDDVIAGFASSNAIPIPWIEPIDISNAMMFLASKEARYITGASLNVSAGGYFVA
ncbi:SDR family mycofactocin-dependent oxidoreductase [Aeromicrobium sp. A1-2]|uniref:mycofactocin-coupled SDR family oxidoreductase n=1 Tax=Aeromicrobium sp. A1-2 TaxID=2107713 RepID=UPI000E524D4E|nr:mycofactocin-coupled SDR family oxidoreductase [Aeromicrobium sp. A1-2]AXT84257.1 SDR family mycofactocin-dependent oxidoreductase [Aeromicrobium sp. A1-2]